MLNYDDVQKKKKKMKPGSFKMLLRKYVYKSYIFNIYLSVKRILH